MSTREHNRRVKRAIAELKAAGATRVVVEICPDGTTRVVEAKPGFGTQTVGLIQALADTGSLNGEK